MIDEKNLKKIPYGVSDFKKIRDNNQYYVDKTRFITHIEEKGYYLYLIRPRRFGKSLLISTLLEYYDILNKDCFDLLFRGTDIYQHPTPFKNSYMILPLNFSIVNSKIEMVEQAFLTRIQNAAKSFFLKYEKILDIDVKEAISDVKSKGTASV